MIDLKEFKEKLNEIIINNIKNGIPIVMIKTIDDTNVIPSLRLSKKSKDKLRNWLEINNKDIHKVFDKKISVEKLRELSKRRKLADEKNLK